MPGRSLARAGSVAALWAAALTLAWVIVLAVAPKPAAGASAAQQLRFIHDHDLWQVASFLPTLPLGALYVVVWIGLAAVIWPVRPAAAVIGVALALLYAPFTTWAYWSQLTVVRGLAELHAGSPARAEDLIVALRFSADRWSVPYSADVLGYSLWGAAALATWVGLRGVAGRPARVTGLLFGISGLLTLLGMAGYLSRNSPLQAGILLSGVTSLFAVLAAAIMLRPPAGT